MGEEETASFVFGRPGIKLCSVRIRFSLGEEEKTDGVMRLSNQHTGGHFRNRGQNLIARAKGPPLGEVLVYRKM